MSYKKKVYREKTWDVEGIVLLKDAEGVISSVYVNCECCHTYGAPTINDVRNDLKNKLVSMVENVEDENVFFSVKKRKKIPVAEEKPEEEKQDVSSPTFIEHEASLQREPTPVLLPGGKGDVE